MLARSIDRKPQVDRDYSVGSFVRGMAGEERAIPGKKYWIKEPIIEDEGDGPRVGRCRPGERKEVHGTMLLRLDGPHVSLEEVVIVARQLAVRTPHATSEFERTRAAGEKNVFRG